MPDAPLPANLRDFLASLPIALTLAAIADDHPLVFANERFADLTGYAPEEMIGHNCRMLQRDVRDGQARAKFAAFLANEAAPAARAPIINFRKDGTPFVNLVYLTRLHTPGGETCWFLGSQFDVSRMEAERLHAYDRDLAGALTTLAPVAAECGIAVDQALCAIGDAVSLMAQTQLSLAGVSVRPD